MSRATHRMAFRHLATGKEHHSGLAIGSKDEAQRVCDDFNRRYGANTFHWPEAVMSVEGADCPRCHGLGYITEDPAPDCPGIGYEETECSACEGGGEVAPEALAAAQDGAA